MFGVRSSIFLPYPPQPRNTNTHKNNIKLPCFILSVSYCVFFDLCHFEENSLYRFFLWDCCCSVDCQVANEREGERHTRESIYCVNKTNKTFTGRRSKAARKGENVLNCCCQNPCNSLLTHSSNIHMMVFLC